MIQDVSVIIICRNNILARTDSQMDITKYKNRRNLKDESTPQ